MIKCGFILLVFIKSFMETLREAYRRQQNIEIVNMNEFANAATLYQVSFS